MFPKSVAFINFRGEIVEKDTTIEYKNNKIYVLMSKLDHIGV